MKNIFSLSVITTLLVSVCTWAQAPQKMSYQATLRDAAGAILTNQKVGVRVSLLQDSEIGALVYQEAHNTATNTSGLVSLDIGAGMVLSGNFTTINWASGTYYMKTETDPAGGTNYSIVGSKQLMSVPYAFYAEKSGSGGSSSFTQAAYYNDIQGNPEVLNYASTNADINATAAGGRDIIDARTWNQQYSRMPNSAFNVHSPLGQLAVDGSGLQSFVSNNTTGEHAIGNLYLNKFGGNTGIGYSNLPSAQATLTVKRGSNSPWGTAAFEGTEHVSHFNFGDTEHTHIRGGKTGASVYINDTHNGTVHLANNAGKVSVNQGDANLTSTFQVRTTTGANSTAEFYPNRGNYTSGSNCATTINYKLDDGTGKFDSTFIRGGSLGARVWLNDAHNGDVIIANGGGNVGIGTNNPTYRLSVNGSLRAKEIRVDADWADFVFEKEYKLRPLAEVEKYILEHKHLPEIPAAKEIEGTEGGLNVGEMSKLFMQKIEELTLYMIEANKQIQELKKENIALKNSISK